MQPAAVLLLLAVVAAAAAQHDVPQTPTPTPTPQQQAHNQDSEPAVLPTLQTGLNGLVPPPRGPPPPPLPRHRDAPGPPPPNMMTFEHTLGPDGSLLGPRARHVAGDDESSHGAPSCAQISMPAATLGRPGGPNPEVLCFPCAAHIGCGFCWTTASCMEQEPGGDGPHEAAGFSCPGGPAAWLTHASQCASQVPGSGLCGLFSLNQTLASGTAAAGNTADAIPRGCKACATRPECAWCTATAQCLPIHDSERMHQCLMGGTVDGAMPVTSTRETHPLINDGQYCPASSSEAGTGDTPRVPVEGFPNVFGAASDTVATPGPSACEKLTDCDDCLESPDCSWCSGPAPGCIATADRASCADGLAAYCS